jgi:hypothetical protein
MKEEKGRALAVLALARDAELRARRYRLHPRVLCSWSAGSIRAQIVRIQRSTIVRLDRIAKMDVLSSRACVTALRCAPAAPAGTSCVRRSPDGLP